jgi:hypothetical protein
MQADIRTINDPANNLLNIVFSFYVLKLNETVNCCGYQILSTNNGGPDEFMLLAEIGTNPSGRDERASRTPATWRMAAG